MATRSILGPGGLSSTPMRPQTKIVQQQTYSGGLGNTVTRFILRNRPMQPSIIFGAQRPLNYMNFMKINIKGINIVRKKLSTGDEIVYVYAWKGGPRIYAPLGSQEFLA